MLWLADIFRVRSPLTSPRSPSRPWPYSDMRAGLRRRRRRQVADVVRRERTRPGAAAAPVASRTSRPPGRAAVGEVQRQLERALDAAADERRSGFSVTVSTVNAGAASPSAAKASSRIAIMRPVRLCVLATVKSHASCRSPRSHAGVGEVGEDPLHRRPARLERARRWCAGRRGTRRTAATAGSARRCASTRWRSPTTMRWPSAKLTDGMDHQQRLSRPRSAIGVELRPERMALAGRRVEQHDRRVGVERAAARPRVRAACDARGVEPVDLHHASASRGSSRRRGSGRWDRRACPRCWPAAIRRPAPAGVRSASCASATVK